MDGNLNKYSTIASQIMKEYPAGSKILSIGSGPCDFEAVLSKLGYGITAIDDLNDHWHLIGKNRERIRNFAKQMNIELITQSAGSPELKENYFDVVLLIDIIEHLHRSPRELLNYSISLLKLNGLLIVETPNTVALVNRLKVLFGKTNQVSADFIYWNVGEYRAHIREYTSSELKQILSYHNLTAVNSKMVNIMIDHVKAGNFLKNIIIKSYKLVSGLYPNFRDTILISGKKPKDWNPTDNSIETFKKYYTHIEKYNLDNEPDEVLVNKILE
ncbi:MAG: Ubiquinone biosynthesis O-methyltransferase [Candidatus Argoarchaeum ethanivorans]|uniref:Ubiquinone biosynthesis O-methyltransferase n=1 Tax=Candidatus Argoarchaeum ethanivorans TaxID=2608793 RepID=A0A811T7C8_9EURY|nr:MAG: Ubiquinone biosynthesis O-methyltransferase [Candidatus Argoarchaeum ethanivorans]